MLHLKIDIFCHLSIFFLTSADAIGVSLFPCRAAAPKKSASDGGIHRDSLAVHLHPMDADAAAGLLRGAEH